LEDGTEVQPNQILNKVWSIQNVGSASWPEGTSVLFCGGNIRPVPANAVPPQMGQSILVPLAKPGEVVNVSICCQAPSEAGASRGYYRLCANGVTFGPNLWVDLKVVCVPPATAVAHTPSVFPPVLATTVEVPVVAPPVSVVPPASFYVPPVAPTVSTDVPVVSPVSVVPLVSPSVSVTSVSSVPVVPSVSPSVSLTSAPPPAYTEKFEQKPRIEQKVRKPEYRGKFAKEIAAIRSMGFDTPVETLTRLLNQAKKSDRAKTFTVVDFVVHKLISGATD